MFYFYILLSLRTKEFYLGFTRNLEKRLKDHFEGRGGWTKNHRPLKLLYYEAHLSQEDAMRREKYFKTSKGKSSLRQMIRTSLAINIS